MLHRGGCKCSGIPSFHPVTIAIRGLLDTWGKCDCEMGESSQVQSLHKIVEIDQRSWIKDLGSKISDQRSKINAAYHRSTLNVDLMTAFLSRPPPPSFVSIDDVPLLHGLSIDYGICRLLWPSSKTVDDLRLALSIDYGIRGSIDNDALWLL